MDKSSQTSDQFPQFETRQYVIWATMVAWTVGLVCAGIFKSASAFLKIDMAMNIVHGSCFLIMPVEMLKTLDVGVSLGKADGGHLYLTYLCGILMLYTAATVWVCVDSEDHTVTCSILWTKLTLAALFAGADGYHYWQVRKGLGSPDKWMSMDITYNLCIMMLIGWIITAVVCLNRFEKWGGYMEHMNRLNFHTRLDYLFTIVVAVLFLAFPDYPLKWTKLTSLDNFHVYLCRCAGIMFIHSALITGKSTSFLYEMTKVRLLFCKFLFLIAMYGIYFGVFYYHKIFVDGCFMYICFWAVLWAGNALAGYLFSRYGQLN